MANFDNKINVLYLDGTDAETEGIFKWNTTNGLLTYTNWKPNEPNDCCGEREDSCCGGEDCLAIFGVPPFSDVEAGQWNDWGCSSLQPSVCEIDTSTRKCLSIT